MDSSEHTASEGASSPAGSRRLTGAILVALALIALGWLVLSVQTTSWPGPEVAAKTEQDTRNAQGLIRLRPPSPPARESSGSTATLAGMKLAKTLGTPIPAESEGAAPAAAAPH